LFPQYIISISISIKLRLSMTAPQDPPAATMADNFESTPGTFLLVDAHGEITTSRAHGTGAEKDIVLVPAPSSHPDDPLNWSPRRKKLSALCMAALVVPRSPEKM
jgi:hypothetical protein